MAAVRLHVEPAIWTIDRYQHPKRFRMASFGLGRTSSEDPSSAAEMDASTPWMAASDGNLSLLQNSLSTMNLEVTAADDYGYTLLHAASAYGQTHVMEWLLAQDVPVNAVDCDGDTPLHHAEDVNAAIVLIEKGKADPTIVNASGKTPLQVKHDDLEELMEEEDDTEEADKLRELISYLSSVTVCPSE